MNCAHRVSSSLAFVSLSFIYGVTASLNCSFQEGFCDWNQTVNQCSWTLANNNCPYKMKGCVYLTDNSGGNCSTAGLTAEIGQRQHRGIYFEYFMTHLGEGSLEVKNDAGEVLWSCNRSQVPPSWQSAQVLLQHENDTKAVTIEAHIPPRSPKYIAVKSVEEAEKIKAATSCASYPVGGATSVIRTSSSFSTIKDLSDSSTAASSPETTAKSIGTENYLTVSTLEASQTTSQPEVTTNRPKEKTLTHLTETETQSTNPCETAVPTGSSEFVSVKPVTGSTDSYVKIYTGISAPLVVGIVAGVIALIIFIVIVVIFLVKWFRRLKTSKKNFSKELQTNPVFETE